MSAGEIVIVLMLCSPLIAILGYFIYKWTAPGIKASFRGFRIWSEDYTAYWKSCQERAQAEEDEFNRRVRERCRLLEAAKEDKKSTPKE